MAVLLVFGAAVSADAQAQPVSRTALSIARVIDSVVARDRATLRFEANSDRTVRVIARASNADYEIASAHIFPDSARAWSVELQPFVFGALLESRGNRSHMLQRTILVTSTDSARGAFSIFLMDTISSEIAFVVNAAELLQIRNALSRAATAAAVLPLAEFSAKGPIEQRPPKFLACPSPQYPEHLRKSGITGVVTAQFVIGRDGRVARGSVRILRSDHSDFTWAVTTVLSRCRYRPATLAGGTVRTVAQQPFVFRIADFGSWNAPAGAFIPIP